MCISSTTYNKKANQKGNKEITENPKTDYEEIFEALERRYQTVGFSRSLFYMDRGLCKRLGKHPALVTAEDLERVILSVPKQRTKALYRARFKSVFISFREMGLIPEDCDPVRKVPKIKTPRSYPRPLTQGEVNKILDEAQQPMLDMLTLSCYAGFRAMEISQVRGVDLEERNDGIYIRIPNGKGKTDLSLPAHPFIIAIFERRKTLDFFWKMRANDVSKLCCAELRRLGINKSLHCGRHFFATNAYAASGGDLLAVSKLMRHSSVATTQVYAELGSEVARNVINNLMTPNKEQDERHN